MSSNICTIFKSFVPENCDELLNTINRRIHQCDEEMLVSITQNLLLSYFIIHRNNEMFFYTSLLEKCHNWIRQRSFHRKCQIRIRQVFVEKVSDLTCTKPTTYLFIKNLSLEFNFRGTHDVINKTLINCLNL